MTKNKFSFLANKNYRPLNQNIINYAKTIINILVNEQLEEDVINLSAEGTIFFRHDNLNGFMVETEIKNINFLSVECELISDGSFNFYYFGGIYNFIIWLRELKNMSEPKKIPNYPIDI
jgi:hypothetical protein